jgi:hypothetical protein
MKPFDNYEISPCRRYEEPDSPGEFYFEVCEPHEADVWTLYGHINGQGVQAIGDFSKREYAEEVFQRITGVPFAGSYTAEAHLRIMHAGPKLFAALQALVATARTFRNVPQRDQQWTSIDDDALEAAFAAIEEATGRAVAPPD